MKTFIITTTADLTPKDIQDFIWMNVDGNFELSVAEITGSIPVDKPVDTPTTIE